MISNSLAKRIRKVEAHVRSGDYDLNILLPGEDPTKKRFHPGKPVIEMDLLGEGEAPYATDKERA